MSFVLRERYGQLRHAREGHLSLSRSFRVG
jgi:hypothetical protein